jgi:hypothetical protein
VDCGDCHLGNLGPVANAKSKVKIAIRDLDQTVIGNPAHDLIRLGLSLATAIRGSDLPGVTTALMLEQMIDGYESQLVDSGKRSKSSDAPPPAVKHILEQALKRRWHHLAEERIEDVTPVIPMGKCFWPLAPVEKKEMHGIFKAPEVRHLILSLQGRDEHDHIRVLDAAYWMKGCSSLGRLRFAVLVGIGKKKQIIFVSSISKNLFRQPLRVFPMRICRATMPTGLWKARASCLRFSDSACLPGNFVEVRWSCANFFRRILSWRWISSPAKKQLQQRVFSHRSSAMPTPLKWITRCARNGEPILAGIAPKLSMLHHGFGRALSIWSPATNQPTLNIVGSTHWKPDGRRNDSPYNLPEPQRSHGIQTVGKCARGQM